MLGIKGWTGLDLMSALIILPELNPDSTYYYPDLTFMVHGLLDAYLCIILKY